jgi:hypothetical protein
MEETEDLDGWLGKPPEIPKAPTPDAVIVVDPDSDVHMSDNNLTDLDIGTPEGLQKIQSEEDRNTQDIRREVILSDDEVDDQEEDDIEADSAHSAASNVYVQVPPLPDDEEEYEYLPGHNRVKRVMSEYKGERFLVKLQSGEADLVSHCLFTVRDRCCLLQIESLICMKSFVAHFSL